MSSETPSRARRALALVTFGLAGAIAGATALPASALADTAAELQSAQQAVQEANQACEQADARVEELDAQIEANQDRIDDIEELGDDDINVEVYSSIDDELIYDDDQWRIMRFYQRPNDANFDEAIDQLAEDCVEIVTKIKKSNEGK